MRKIFCISFLLCFDCRSYSIKDFVPLNRSITNAPYFERKIEEATIANFVFSYELSKHSVVLLIGDSLGVGMKSRFIELAQLCNYNPVVHAVSGSSTFQWLKWINKDLSRYSPNLVIISLGTNDALSFELAKKEDVYKKFVSNFKATKHVWILPHNIESNRVPNVVQTRELIKKSSMSYFDSSKLKLPLSPDKIHLTSHGYKSWIDSVWKFLNQQGTVCNSLIQKP